MKYLTYAAALILGASAIRLNVQEGVDIEESVDLDVQETVDNLLETALEESSRVHSTTEKLVLAPCF